MRNLEPIIITLVIVILICCAVYILPWSLDFSLGLTNCSLTEYKTNYELCINN